MAALALLGLSCRDSQPLPRSAGHRKAPAARASPAPLLSRQDLGRERSLAPGAEHLYRLDLARGSYLHVVIEQRGVDVYSQLLDPAGRALVQVDSHSGKSGTEQLYHVAEVSGAYQLRVRAFPNKPRPGNYRARIVAERPASDRDRRRTAAEQAFADAYASPGAADGTAPPPATIAGYRRALALWRQLGDRRRQADALGELADLYRQAGERGQAIDYYRQSLPLLDRPDDRRDRGIALNQLALTLVDDGEPGEASADYEQALKLFRSLGDQRYEALVLDNLGRLEGLQGKHLRALERLGQAAARWQQLDDRRELVTTLNLTGEQYASLGETELALDQHRRALELLDPQREPLARARTLSFIGRTLLDTRDLAGAATAYQEAFELFRRTGYGPGMVTASTGLGMAEERRGNPRRALALYRQALAAFDRTGTPLQRAMVTNDLAWLYGQLGEAAQAEVLHRQALAVFLRAGDHEGVAASYFGLSQAQRLRRQDDAALASAEAALAEIEEVLGAGPPQTTGDLRISFIASRQDYFDLYVDLLMEQHRRHPAAGFDALALATSEQARARNLLEILAQAPLSRREAAAPGTTARRLALQAEINAADLAVRRLRAAGQPREAAEAERRQRQRLLLYYRLAGESGRRGPWKASLQAPRLLALPEIQDLLDDDTVLLEFYLGSDHSYLWMVTRQGLESHELAPPAAIERLARRAYDLLTKSDRITHRIPAQAAMAELSRALLAPVAPRLARRRLLIVAGGALEYIPFSALPLPDDPAGRLLLADHEIVHLPSASVLAVLRRQTANRPAPRGLLALLADPVLNPRDERLAGRADVPSPPDAGAPAFERLVHSRREAEAILALARSRGPVLAALGFDADRELALSGRLAGYRIVHFATHGVLHTDHPELSALMLSSYRPDGGAREGRLSLFDVYDLRLSADLVVLSACRSALGKEVRGEGLLGLPRGFLYAGAKRVLVSLWDAQDESTAELMKRFYFHLLAEAQPPAAALRSAQLSMLSEARYAPYHWAGFELQGDWR